MDPNDVVEFPYGVAGFLIALGLMFSFMGFISWWDITVGNHIVTYPKFERRTGLCLGIFSALFVIAWIIEIVIAPPGKGPTSQLPGIIFVIGSITSVTVAFFTKEH